nr:MAG TPA: hypothetical protein [Caudoviricetes sp.]
MSGSPVPIGKPDVPPEVRCPWPLRKPYHKFRFWKTHKPGSFSPIRQAFPAKPVREDVQP